MRTTLDLADPLFDAAKRRAAEERITFKSVVERALRQYLEPPAAKPGKYRLQWRVESGELLPGVPVDNRSDMLDYFDKLDKKE